MRLFVALNLPPEERDRIHRAARRLRDQELPVRWVGAENYHLTLKFLGEVRAERVPAIEAILHRVAAAAPSFSADLRGFGAFPSIRRPRVLWLGVEPTAALRCLKQDVEWGLADLGFERETRAFHPHLTLGRVAEDSGAGAFRGLDELVPAMGYDGSIEVRTVELMRSQTGKTGSQYSVVSSHPLTQG
jgi:RNA 2',3'-cyclic 3'-phosphodiesterase